MPELQDKEFDARLEAVDWLGEDTDDLLNRSKLLIEWMGRGIEANNSWVFATAKAKVDGLILDARLNTDAVGDFNLWAMDHLDRRKANLDHPS